MKLLSIVLPVRVSDDRDDIIERLSYFKLDTQQSDEINFVVIDDGSSRDHSKYIEDFCISQRIAYYRIDSETQRFSVGRVRNYAAQHLETKYIMFQDVDLMPYPGFYKDILIECKVQKLDKFADRFIMVGVIYLTESASEEFLETNPAERKSKFIGYLLAGDSEKVEKFSTGTSVTVWRRDHYLCTGGNDPEFEGWGYEDLEYACRAIRRNRIFPLPDEFELDYKNFTSILEYSGWKSVYRLFGDMTFQKGIVMFHRWHPVHQEGAYIQRRKHNKLIFEKKLAQFEKNGTEPDPLPKKECGKSLLFKDNPWVLNRWTAPNLGDIVVVNEDYFDECSIVRFVVDNKISRVVFHNPYASEKMLSLYRAIRNNNINYLVCERGALRDSVFFDPNGFNADSSSYHPNCWDKPLSSINYQKTIDYIINEKEISDSLEEQSSYLSSAEIKKKLKLKNGRKILFVPLQRPSDTVIKYFSGPIFGFNEFIDSIKRLTHVLPCDWDIVVKKHPLEVDMPEIPGVYYANNENIKSLINISDALYLINSGVGVLGLLYEKPVLVAGSAFYDHPGLTKSVATVDDVIEAILNFKPEKEKILRFLSYLVNEFYSFGRFTTRTVPWADGAKMTATTGIDFYCVRFPGADEMILERSLVPTIVENSVIFDRYKNGSGAIKFRTSASVLKNNRNQDVEIYKNQVGESSVRKNKSRTQAKIAKFKKDPVRFFEDSKIPFFRVIGKILK
jgi:predicted glycosyltransferase involved in capsule biosynthesis